MGNVEEPQAAEEIAGQEEELQLPEDVSKVKDQNEGTVSGSCTISFLYHLAPPS